MKIAIIGLGFVGLTFACILGKKDYHIIGIDSDKSKIERIQNGRVPFFEPKLNQTLKNALKKKFSVTSSNKVLESNYDLIFVTVGTPQEKNGDIDLTMIKSVSGELSKLIKKSTNKPIVVIKSTVIPGTTNDVILPILEKKSGKKIGKDFGLITNPEFLRESQAVNDTINPHVIVLGGKNDIFMKKLIRFYKKFHGKIPIIQTNSQTAEIIKYANNSFLATKISFINQLANICQNIPGANIDDIARIIGLDPRIGKLFLNAGAG